MVLGTSLFALLLIGAPQEPPIVPPGGGPGSDFIVFMEPVLGDWDGGGGEKPYYRCKKDGPNGEGMYRLIYFTKDGKRHETHYTSGVVVDCWISMHCNP